MLNIWGFLCFKTESTCLVGAQHNSGDTACFWSHSDAQTYAAAQQTCANEGGEILQMKSQVKQDEVRSMITQQVYFVQNIFFLCWVCK